MTAKAVRTIAALAGVLVMSAAASHAQPADTAASASPQRELIVGTKVAPPFAIKESDGSWDGISIDLWRRIADQLHLHYRFSEEPDVETLIDGVATGKLDVAVAALTVTAARARIIDFTEPFYVTGLGIAVPASGEPGWLSIVHTIMSFGFAQAVLVLIGLALAVGILVWWFERRDNELFGGGVTRGVSTGVWWSTVAMTQRHAGEVSPRTLPGRIIAIVWMVVSIITIAVFTASVTSVLTVKHLQGAVHGVSDLSSVRVGAVAGTSTEGALSQLEVRYRRFATPEMGLVALRNHSIDAFVYDKPLLAWIIAKKFSASVELIEPTFDSQDYALALPADSPLRKAIDVAMLDAIHSDWWQQTTVRYLGSH